MTAAVSALAGLAVGADVRRSVSTGLYLVGSFLLVAGFFVGNRGPARARGTGDAGPVAGLFGIGIGARRLRWATRDEQEESIAHSAVFVVLGLVLLVLGVAADDRFALT